LRARWAPAGLRPAWAPSLRLWAPRPLARPLGSGPSALEEAALGALAAGSGLGDVPGTGEGCDER